MIQPHYSYPPWLVVGAAASLLSGGRRSFADDARACLARLRPPLRVLGSEHMPVRGPCLITFNHYFRPGFRAWWMALALAAAVPQPIHFVMTAELTFPGRWYGPLGRAASRWLLGHFSRIYGFTTMPPMPPRPRDVAARALAVRRTLEFARRHPAAILGVAPEGGDNPPSGALARPAPGAGRFLLLLAALGHSLRPVGIYEEGGQLCLHFGPAYRLSIPAGLPPGARDRDAVGIAMRAVAALLPERLRGPFA
jgi:1-acyl-sn-glycerol-3-phosphate acyltransferase